ncbi:hypothetical protein [Pseudomonas sp. PONIH3]
MGWETSVWRKKKSRLGATALVDAHEVPAQSQMKSNRRYDEKLHN